MSYLGPYKATIEVSKIEIVCLKKLSLVSHVLAKKIEGSAGREQECLAKTLDDIILRLEIASVEAA